MNDSINAVLDFWYDEENAKKWFKSSSKFDAKITQRFESLWQSAADNNLEEWEKSAEGCLALCIVLDQFPLNLFRGKNKSFQTEQQSIEVAKAAIEKGFDNDIDAQRVSFLYMPLMHSESALIHQQAVILFNQPGLEKNYDFELKHKAIIDRFGRYPHRNDILGRHSTPEELEFLSKPGSSF